jgi:phosphatidylglycerol---prolipoprotein diacylglyceryl transferase
MVYLFLRTHVEIFAVIIAAGAVLGLVQVARHAPPDVVVSWLDAALVTLLGALVGARLSFVFMHLDYFRNHPLEAPQVWLGGLDWPGAVAGGLIAVLVVSAFMDLPFRQVADRLAHLAPPLAIAAWLGCWIAGCGYGYPSAVFGLPAMAEDSSFSVRFPVQIMAAFFLLCYYACLEIGVRRSLLAGRRAGLIGLGLAANLLLFSFLRADPTPSWSGLRPDTWASALMGILFLVMCLFPTGSTREEVAAA